MPRTYYKFAGGEYLTRISASWFVSYMYYIKKDATHSNWNKVSTVTLRKNIYYKSNRFHLSWIREIINMNPKNLNGNSIGLTGAEVIKMAKELLTLFTNCGSLQTNRTTSFNIHISYQKKMQLKEFANLLNTINLSVNDYYRDNGLSSNELHQHAAIVSNVRNGSIWLEIIISVFSEVASSLLAEYISQRLCKNKEKCNANEIHIEAGDYNTINVFVNNK